MIAKKTIYISTKSVLRHFMHVSLICLFLTSSLSGITQALPPEQKKIFDRGINYYDVAACSPSDTAQSESNIGGAVYVVGDSITVRAKGDLEAAFQAKNAQTYINASTSRSITKPGTDDGYKTSGLEAIEGDKERVRNAKSIVIALGTNQRDADFEKSVKDIINKTAGYNSEAKIYWVNVFSDGVDKNAINKSIDQLSSDQNYTVIDTTDKNIELDSDKIHETIGSGTQAFAGAVVDSISGTGAASSTTSSQCVCGGGSTALDGSNNAEKVWNYFQSQGLSKKSVAAAFGNLEIESAGFTVINGWGGGGGNYYGLAQWSRNDRYPKLVAFAGRENAGKLEYQLRFIWEKELKEPYYKPTLDALNGNGSLESKVITWGRNYEGAITNGALQLQDRRISAAKNALIKYGSRSSGGASSDSAVCAAGAGGEVVGEFSLPVAKKWYTQHPEWFTKPHHNKNPAADIPVPEGSKIFAVAKGKVTSMANSGYGGGAGTHAFINDGEVTYGYFHGIPGSLKVRVGDTVEPGQLIMLSDNTGHSLGTHLHFQIEVSGAKRCPQGLLDSIGKGSAPPAIKSLPSTGCTN